MGKPACKVQDVATGHQCFPPNPIIQGSPNVFINGQPAARKGDKLEKHCCYSNTPFETCHDGEITEGAKTVIINGKGAAFVTHKVSCSQILMTGSSNVMIGS